MKTTLTAAGHISIPPEIRHADHLAPGDSFELERLSPGHYLLAKQQPQVAPFTVVEGADGLPLIRVAHGVITSRLVNELESQSP